MEREQQDEFSPIFTRVVDVKWVDKVHTTPPDNRRTETGLTGSSQLHHTVTDGLVGWLCKNTSRDWDAGYPTYVNWVGTMAPGFSLMCCVVLCGVDRARCRAWAVMGGTP